MHFILICLGLLEAMPCAWFWGAGRDPTGTGRSHPAWGLRQSPSTGSRHLCEREFSPQRPLDPWREGARIEMGTGGGIMILSGRSEPPNAKGRPGPTAAAAKDGSSSWQASCSPKRCLNAFNSAGKTSPGLHGSSENPALLGQKHELYAETSGIKHPPESSCLLHRPK